MSPHEQEQRQVLLIQQFYLYCLQVLFARDIALFFLFFISSSVASGGTENLAEKSGTLEDDKDSSEGDIENRQVKDQGILGQFASNPKKALGKPEKFSKPLMGSLLGQEYDPENSLYYYNARYYDPSIGIFTTADTIIPDEYDPLSYNRHMYVRGNPINYTDPSGHSWKAVGNFFKGLIKGIGSFVSTILSPITAIVAGIQSLATGASFTSTFTNHFNGVAAAASSLILAPVALNPLLTGIISELSGGSFEEGFAAGLGNLGLAIGTFGGSILASAGNAYAAGYHGIYSNDAQGSSAYFLDHTVGQGTTAIGTVAALAHLAGGGKFESKLSKGSNAFIYSNSPFSRSNSVGNTIGLSKRDSARLGTADGKRVLREELLHNWQYRRGGLLSLTRLVLEQIGPGNPYTRRGTLEYEASRRSVDGTDLERSGYSGLGKPRPWELQCSTCDRFY